MIDHATLKRLSALWPVYAPRPNPDETAPAPLDAPAFDVAAKSAIFEFARSAGYGLRIVGPTSTAPMGGASVLHAIQTADGAAWYYLILDGHPVDVCYSPPTADFSAIC